MPIQVITSVGGNTGQTRGDVRMGRIKYMLLTRGKEFSASDLADSDSLKTAMETAIYLSRTATNKIFVFDGIREAEDNSGDPNVGTLGDGYEEVLNEALPKFILRTTNGVAQQQSIVAFNGFTDKIFFVDDKNLLWYKNTSSGGGKGFSVSYFYAEPPKPGSTGAVKTNSIRISFGDVDEFKSDVGCVRLDFSPASLADIIDVTLKEKAAASGYDFKIALITKYAGIDQYDAYADALEQEAAWKVTKVSDGSTVTVTTAVKDAVNKCITLTLSSSPTIASGEKLYIELVDPAALKALATPILGIESVRVKVTKP